MRACTSEAVFTTVVAGGRTTVGRNVTGAGVVAVLGVFVVVFFFAAAFFFAAGFFAAGFFAAGFFAGARLGFFVDFVFFAGAMGRTLAESRVC